LTFRISRSRKMGRAWLTWSRSDATNPGTCSTSRQGPSRTPVLPHLRHCRISEPGPCSPAFVRRRLSRKRAVTLHREAGLEPARDEPARGALCLRQILRHDGRRSTFAADRHLLGQDQTHHSAQVRMSVSAREQDKSSCCRTPAGLLETRRRASTVSRLREVLGKFGHDTVQKGPNWTTKPVKLSLLV